MRLIATMMMMMMVSADTTAMAAETSGETGRRVTVCMDRNTGPTLFGTREASKLFAGIGVAVEWHPAGACPSTPGAIHVSVSDQAPPPGHRADMAYALPYEGTRTVLFYGRIRDMARDKHLLVSRLLAYVLAHEIAHVLQGMSQHAESGIMKAQWDRADDLQMQRNTLRFTPSDVDLILRGFAARPAVKAAHERGTIAAN